MTGHLHENAETLSAIPLADLKGPPGERIRAVDARIRAIGSDSVLEGMDRVATMASRFSRDLLFAQLEHRRVRAKGDVDSEKTIIARMGLGTLADEMKEAIKDLESRIRAEMRI